MRILIFLLMLNNFIYADQNTQTVCNCGCVTHVEGNNEIFPCTCGHCTNNPAVNGFINTGHDDIPDFASNPSVVSIKNGMWSDVTTWSTNVVPSNNSVVKVLHNVTIDINANVHTIGIVGKLDFAANVTTRCVNILIYPEGTLEQFQPNTILFKDVPPSDNMEFSNGLICLGTWRTNGSAQKYFYNGDSPPGTSAFYATTTLKDGAKLVFADSRTQVVHDIFNYTGFDQLESRVITANQDHYTFTPLQFFHSHKTPVAYIAGKTVIASENPNGHRGHVIITGHARFELNDILFSHLGRTKAEPLHNGTATNHGNNQIGRYSLHIHRVHNGDGSYVQYCVIDNADRWGAAIHGTAHVKFMDNVIYDCKGAGVAIEDGSEYNNDFLRNYVLKVTGVEGLSANQRGHEASQRQGNGWWIQGLNNQFQDNIVANTRSGGFNFFMQDGFDTSVGPASNNFVSPNLETFTGNKVLCSAFGIETWRLQGNTVKVKDFYCYNTMRGIRIPFVTDHMDIDGFIYESDYISSDHRYASMGFDIDGGYIQDLKAKNFQVTKADYGYFSREMTPPFLGLTNGQFNNCKYGIYISQLVHQLENTAPMKTVFMNNLVYNQCVDPVSIFTGQVVSRLAPLNGMWRIIALFHNGGDSYEIFTPEQTPNFVVPPYVINGLPFYGTGKANSLSWVENSIAIGMQVAPTNTINGDSLGFRNLIVGNYNIDPQVPPLRVMLYSYEDGYLKLAVLGDRSLVNQVSVKQNNVTTTYPIPADVRPFVSIVKTEAWHYPSTVEVKLLKDGVVVQTKTITIQ